MATSVGSLYLDLRANSTGLSKDMAKAIQKTRRELNASAKVIAGAATAAFAGMSVVVKQQMGEIDELAKTARKLRFPVEELQAFQKVAQEAGVGNLNTGLRMMEVNISKAASGTGEAVRSLDALGLSAEQLARLAPQDQYKAIAEKLRDVENASDRARIAQEIFGESGVEMLNMIDQGAEAIEKARARLDAMGATLSGIDVAKVEQANDAMNELQLVAQGAANQFTVALAPVLTGISEKLVDMAIESGGFRSVALDVVEVFVKGGAIVGNVIQGWQVIINAGQLALLMLGSTATRSIAGIYGAFVDLNLGAREFLADIVDVGAGAFSALLRGAAWMGGRIGGLMVSGVNRAISGINALIDKLPTWMRPDGGKIPTLDFKLNLDTSGAQGFLSGLGDGVRGMGSGAEGLMTGVRSGLDGMAQAFADAATEAKGEMQDILNQPLATTAVDGWLADVRARSDEAATNMQEGVQGVAAEAETLFENIKTAGQQAGTMIQTVILAPIQAAFDELSNSIRGLIDGTMTWSDALGNIALTVATTVLQAFVSMAAAWLTTWIATQLGIQAMGAASTAAGTASSAAAATALTAAWFPAAMFASIATFGEAAAAGGAVFGMAMMAGAAAAGAASVLAGALSSVGFAVGQMGGAAISGQRAAGGSVEAGRLYQVNERGTEYFRPSGSGMIVPMGEANRKLGRADQAPRITITQNFPAGVTQADLINASVNIKRDTMAGVADAMRRGGSYRKAFAA